MAGGASANPSSPTSVPMRTQGPTTSAFTPRFATLPTAPSTSAPGTYSLNAAAQPGFAQQGAPYQPFASRMPANISGYGNFPQAPTSVNTGPTADQVRAQMLAYQQQYKPGMQQAQQEVGQYAANLRAAEEARKAEIARQAELARQAAAAAEAERLRREQEAASSSDGGWSNQYNGGASGGLASLQGFN